VVAGVVGDGVVVAGVVGDGVVVAGVVGAGVGDGVVGAGVGDGVVGAGVGDGVGAGVGEHTCVIKDDQPPKWMTRVPSPAAPDASNVIIMPLALISE